MHVHWYHCTCNCGPIYSYGYLLCIAICCILSWAARMLWHPDGCMHLHSFSGTVKYAYLCLYGYNMVNHCGLQMPWIHDQTEIGLIYILSGVISNTGLPRVAGHT